MVLLEPELSITNAILAPVILTPSAHVGTGEPGVIEGIDSELESALTAWGRTESGFLPLLASALLPANLADEQAIIRLDSKSEDVTKRGVIRVFHSGQQKDKLGSIRSGSTVWATARINSFIK